MVPNDVEERLGRRSVGEGEPDLARCGVMLAREVGRDSGRPELADQGGEPNVYVGLPLSHLHALLAMYRAHVLASPCRPGGVLPDYFFPRAAVIGVTSVGAPALAIAAPMMPAPARAASCSVLA